MEYRDSPAHFCQKLDSKYEFFLLIIFLQLASLTLDGLTGASQDRMRAEHKTKAHRMMLAVNFWSMLYLGAGICMDFNCITKLCFPGEVD